MTLEKYFGHICKSGSQFAPVNWLAHELWLFFSPGAETSAAGKCHERGLAQALQHMAFAITTYPELRWHWVGSFHQLLLNFVFFKSRLLSVFSFNKFLQYLITDSLCYCSRNSCIYISTCCRHNPPIREAVGSYVFSILVELQHNCISGISVGSTQALKSFWGAKVFLAICKGPAWSILARLLKAPGHSLQCLLPTCTKWLPRL